MTVYIKPLWLIAEVKIFTNLELKVGVETHYYNNNIYFVIFHTE